MWMKAGPPGWICGFGTLLKGTSAVPRTPSMFCLSWGWNRQPSEKILVYYLKYAATHAHTHDFSYVNHDCSKPFARTHWQEETSGSNGC